MDVSQYCYIFRYDKIILELRILNFLKCVRDMMTFQVNKWYKSQDEIRSYFSEYRKGILSTSTKTAIIMQYRGSRQKSYKDYLNLEKGEICYIGEGKIGDQKLNPRNQKLIDHLENSKPIFVFLDCGGCFSPNKKLFCAGKWIIKSVDYKMLGGRKVYKFLLEPEHIRILNDLRFAFSESSVDKDFEKQLKIFARERHLLTSKFSSIVRTKDNFSGEIGEYFAIKYFNKVFEEPLIRLTSAYKSIDAIQLKYGKRVAIKTVTKIPSMTSNIWDKKLNKNVDGFIIVILDNIKLKPINIFYTTVRGVEKFLYLDKYQKTLKIKISHESVRRWKKIL